MQCRKKEEIKKVEEAGGHDCLACQGCGKIVKAEECSWQDDDDGPICCQDCRAERESCGCSD